MLGDADEVEVGTTLEADLCIVGAGAGGIAIAQALAGRSLRVLVLESGRLEPDPGTQRLYQGTVLGAGQPPLDAVRLRYFGGTTNHWVGWCGPLDPEDFAVRPWVPDSGWPLARADLDPWYARAHALCDLGPADYGQDAWGRFAAPLPARGAPAFELRLIQHSPPTRFGEKFRGVLAAARNVRVLLGANLTELVPDAAAKTVQRAEVATLSGRRFRVRARRYVLACGAVENARLLLASSRVVPAGLGNERDLVGRYYMDHPRLRPAGVLFPTGPHGERLSGFVRREGVRATLAACLPAEVQRQQGLLNHRVFTDAAEPPAAFGEADVPSVEVADFLRRLAGREGRELSRWWVRVEQSPNRHSRVRLGDERDALGLRRPVLDWRLHERERRTLAVVGRAFGEVLTRAGLARVRLAPGLADAEAVDRARVTSDWHQLGTTRMAAAPERGVVDPDCRVFGLDNLYVAGASVFPTAGAMNPTLTLVALALRLADHLAVRP